MGTLGELVSEASSISNNGQIVGMVETAENYKATLFDATGGGKNINLGGGSFSYAYSINNNGQIVGWAYTAGFPHKATLFDATGGGKNISLSESESYAYSINSNGQIVGGAVYTAGYCQATLFDATGGGENISLSEFPSYASSINNNGQIVGYEYAAGKWQATLFDATGGGKNINLGTVGESQSMAYSINDNGQIVGYVYAAGNWRATLFDATGGGKNISLSESYSYASSINDNGQIVGYVYAAGKWQATLFDATGGGANINLNTLINPTLGWNLEIATSGLTISINDNGWIVGSGISPNGPLHAFLLIPMFTPTESWVEIKEDGACIVEDKAGVPDETIPLKCYPNAWILERETVDGAPIEAEIDTEIWWLVIDLTDNVSGWIKKADVACEPSMQLEWEKRTDKFDPSKNPGEGGTVSVILEAVNHYYNNTSDVTSLYSSNDENNYLSLLKEANFPIELILAIIAQESYVADFDNENISFDYGHGIMQITFRPVSSDIKYLQIVLNSDPDTQVASSGAGSPGNETSNFGPATEEAVKKFQKKYDRPNWKGEYTGRVYFNTRDKLNELLGFNQEFFEQKGIPSDFRFENYLFKGRKDITSINDTFDNRGSKEMPGTGSKLRIPPSDNLFDSKDKNYYKHSYAYKQSSAFMEYKEYEPHQYYNNQTFKYYTNSSQEIYANIKDGLCVLSQKLNDARPHYNSCANGVEDWTKCESLIPSVSCEEMHWISAVQRYNGYNGGVPSSYLAEYNATGELVNGIAYRLKHLQEYFQISNNTDLANKIEAVVKAGMVGVKIFSPGEVRVADSNGRVSGLVNGEIKEEIPNSFYDEEQEGIVIFFKNSDYLYQVLGMENGTYGLEIASTEDGNNTVFESLDIPTSPGTVHQYSIDWQALSVGQEGVILDIDNDGDGIFETIVIADNNLTQSEFALQTETTVDINPNVINLKSKGGCVTVYIELPKDYNVGDINISTLTLAEDIPAEKWPVKIGDYDKDGVKDLMVKFDRCLLIDLLSDIDNNQDVELTVSGYLRDGTRFAGSDIIKVINPGRWWNWGCPNGHKWEYRGGIWRRQHRSCWGLHH